MRSPALAPHPSASSAKRAARAPVTLPPQAGARAAANDDAETDLEHGANPPNPLWVIAIGMAVFFGVTAALMIGG